MTEKIDFQLNYSNIPKVFLNLEFEVLQEVHPELIKICKLYIHNFPTNIPKGIYLYSSTPGNAKSSLAALILKGVIQQSKIKHKATFIDFQRLIIFLRQKYVYNKEFSITDDLESVIDRSELLVMDDIGKDILDKQLSRYYFMIVNMIYSKQIPTIWTSNFAIKNLCKQFEVEDEIVNPMLSKIESLCKVVRLTNKDYRICSKKY